jgi:hypothetical protein
MVYVSERQKHQDAQLLVARQTAELSTILWHLDGDRRQVLLKAARALLNATGRYTPVSIADGHPTP